MEEIREKEMDLMRRLIRTLEDENNSKNMERNSLHVEIDRLRHYNHELLRQVYHLKKDSVAPTEVFYIPPELIQYLEFLRANCQTLTGYNTFLKEYLDRLGNYRSYSYASLRYELRYMEREMVNIQNRINDEMGNTRMLETQADMIREKEEKINYLQEYLRNKDRYIECFVRDIGYMRAQIMELSEELQGGRMEDVHNQMEEYERELRQSRRAYEDLKESAGSRIELLYHKLYSMNIELRRQIDEKSSNLQERNEMGRAIAELRQINHSLAQQLQAARKEYYNFVKEAEEAGFENPKQTQYIMNLKNELSSLIAINLNLSNELALTRDRSRMKPDVYSSRGMMTDRTMRMEAFSEIQGNTYRPTRLFTENSRVEYMRGSLDKGMDSRRDKSSNDKFIQHELKKLKYDMGYLKKQNDSYLRRNQELTEMNEFLLKKNTDIQLAKNDMTPCLIRVEEEVIEEKKSKRYLVRKSGNRNPPRLSISGGSDHSLKIIDSKAKWLTLQKKLQYIKIEDPYRISPSKSRNL